MRLKLICAILGICVGAISQKGELDGATLYDVRFGNFHVIMSDNATPDNVLDDWLVDWERL